MNESQFSFTDDTNPLCVLASCCHIRSTTHHHVLCLNIDLPTE